MKLRKKDESNFIRVGMFITILVTFLMILIVSIGKENSLFKSKVKLKAQVENVQNLKVGSYVELKGIKVGTVDSITIKAEDQVEIQFTILESELKWVKKDSKVMISTAGLVGDKFLEIYHGTKGAQVFNPSEDILFSEHQSDFKHILTKGESIASITERILNRIDTVLYNMEDGKKLIDTLETMNRASLNIEKITQEIREARLGQSLKTMQSTAGRMDKIMSRIEHGPGTLNSLIYDDSLHEDLRAVLGGASRNKVIKYFIRESIKGSERKKPKTED